MQIEKRLFFSFFCPYVFPVVEYPFVVRIFGKGLLNAVYSTIDVGFHHASDLDRHVEGEVYCI